MGCERAEGHHELAIGPSDLGAWRNVIRWVELVGNVHSSGCRQASHWPKHGRARSRRRPRSGRGDPTRSRRPRSGPGSPSPRSWRPITGRDVPVGRRLVVGVGDPIVHVIVVTGEVDMRRLFLRPSEQQGPRAARRRLRFFEQGVREDMDGQGASEFRDVTVRVGNRARPLDLVGDKDRVDVVRRRGPRRYGDGDHRVDLFVPDQNVLVVAPFPHVIRERGDLTRRAGPCHGRGHRRSRTGTPAPAPTETKVTPTPTSTSTTPTSTDTAGRSLRCAAHGRSQPGQIGKTPRPAEREIAHRGLRAGPSERGSMPRTRRSARRGTVHPVMIASVEMMCRCDGL